MLVANNAPNFERNDLDIHFFRYSGAFGARHLGRHTAVRRLPFERHSYPGSMATRRMRGIRERGPKPDDPPAAPPPKSKLTCKLAYDLRLPPYAACLRLP